MNVLAGAEFRNESGLKFTDISSESWRQYEFPSGSNVVIYQPKFLCVSDNGHRIFDMSGVSHYVPKGWIHLSWLAKDGQPHFVK
jgi:hypothetical protein